MAKFSDPLWVITSYYNPAGYKRRLANFRAFRRNLAAPLLVVELSKPGSHQLADDDADIVLRLTGEDRLWQKERLLNIGVAHLPAHVEYVAWADCDLIFERSDWPLLVCAMLERHGGMTQLFDTSIHLPKEVDPAQASLRQCLETPPSYTGVAVARNVANSTFLDNEQKVVEARRAGDEARFNQIWNQHNCYGFGWAAPRAVLEKCGLYDRNVVGGGDTAKIFAALNELDAYWKIRPYAPAHRADIERWRKEALGAGLFAHIDAAPQKAFHLWHGELVNRQYLSRYDILAGEDFDPARDLVLAENGTWAWANPEGGLARKVEDYFFARHEDGV